VEIIVCIKQVPEGHSVRIDPTTHALVRQGGIINPFDENALEAALQVKEAHGGRVTAICMGPPDADRSLRQALALGADAAVLLTGEAYRRSDTLATSCALAAAIRKLFPAGGEPGFDLILCGKQAIDGDTAQVPPGLAERLGLPQVTFAVGLEIENGRLRARRLLDDAYETVEIKLPALVSVVKQINTPRLPAMRGVLRAKKAEIITWDAPDLGVDLSQVGGEGSPTAVIKTFSPERRQRGQLLEGSPEELAGKFVEIVRGLNLSRAA
jgi:electron transfer flavoprotein beta subunit